MRVINEPEYKIYRYINTSKMINDKIEFENCTKLFENNKLT